jgi:hypothetical protein
MVTQLFIDNLNKNIMDELKNVISGHILIKPFGTDVDQHKGLADDLKTALIPFRKSNYTAEEQLFVRIPVNNPHFSHMDFVTPVLNVKGKSVMGIATFSAVTSHPIPETFVERMVGFSYKLVPHKLAVELGEKPKKIIKENKITSKAVKLINEDKKMCNCLHGSSDNKVFQGMLSKQFYKISIDWLEYPPGMFTIVPYNGKSVMLAKEAGKSGSFIDKPIYHFRERFDAFAGVAKYLAENKEEGEKIGKFYMDNSIQILLSYLPQ